jgi:hypothetical protein
MKKFLLTICLTLVILFSSNVNAQSTYAFSVHGGYSWLNGVVGADLHIGNIGISGGWMPTSMPISGNRVNSYGGAFSIYTGKPDETSYYASIGVASQGFRYEDTWGYEATSPMTIVMVGVKSGTDKFNFKLGAGYGWCEYGDAWTFEATLGFVLFKNINNN